MAKLLVRNGVAVVATFISPYREMREHCRREIPNFIEVYVRCPLEECIRRDPKGLYKRALAGQIPSFTGLDDPFEEPESPDIVVDTATETPEESARRIEKWLVENTALSPPSRLSCPWPAGGQRCRASPSRPLAPNPSGWNRPVGRNLPIREVIENIMVDIHCHILPFLDDGARNWDEALAMAGAARAAGFGTVVATPHYEEGLYANDRRRVLAAVEELRARLAEAGIPLEVLPGCEARLDPGLPEAVQLGRAATLGDGGRFLLVELPPWQVPAWAGEVLFQLRLLGLTPILAHPERHAALQRDDGLLRAWVEQGVLAQVDAGSVEGEHGGAARRAAQRWLRAGLVHLAGSDAHRPAQAGRFTGCARLWSRLDAALAREVAGPAGRGEVAACGDRS